MSYAAVLGGAERILLDRARALRGAAALACPPGPLADAGRAAGLEIVSTREWRSELRGSARDRVGAPLRMAAFGREVRRAIIELQPGCVIGSSMRGALAGAAALTGMRSAPPLVFCQNDFVPSPAIRAAVRAAAGRAARVVALSHAVAEDLDPAGRLGVEVIHPGVDLERFVASPPPDGPPRVLVLGAIVAWKRPDLAIDVAELAARRVPGLRVHLVGAPLGDAGRELARALERRAAGAGVTSLHGGVEDVPGALAGATCLLHCADREPFGVAIAEALASGRPVVAPAAGGPREIVDEHCGALYEPGDAVAAADALVRVVGSAPELAAAARARAERLFDARASNRRFAKLVDGLT